MSVPRTTAGQPLIVRTPGTGPGVEHISEKMRLSIAPVRRAVWWQRRAWNTIISNRSAVRNCSRCFKGENAGEKRNKVKQSLWAMVRNSVCLLFSVLRPSLSRDAIWRAGWERARREIDRQDGEWTETYLGGGTRGRDEGVDLERLEEGEFKTCPSFMA